MESDNKNILDEKYAPEVEATEQDSVQSCAVIRQAEAAPLVPYQKLKLNTDLNLPPSNWLYGNNSFRFLNRVPSNSSEYSSFKIALQNIDLIGDVDVVSWGQNVKSLLKIPYNPNAQVSLMLHKIGKTLLIDEFDLNTILRNNDFHWEWFRDFFIENVLNSFKADQKVLRPNKSRSVVINRNLFSKFLYYSLGDSSRHCSANTSDQNGQQFSVTQSFSNGAELEPPIDPSNDEQPSVDKHVIWNFEDIKMLIGTDLPIFEGKDNLCISLRLNDISKPINVLTGLDYWLDNLMCNVPEVAMCYHFQGLVKEYDFMKTEDLPNLTDTKFSPKEVLDVAQNILTFLKSKATKEGHTYWLFKAKDDLYVKLYDLTSLCDKPEEFFIGPETKTSQANSSTSENPFALPVAMLCYKVAERMNSCNSSSLHAQICSLLNNTLKLLSPENYPQMCCAANYLQSDVYLPKELNPQSPHLSDVSDDEDEPPQPKVTAKRKKDEGKKSKNESKKSKNESKKSKKKTNENISVKAFSRPFSKDDWSTDDFPKPPPLDKDLLVRCAQARDCVLEAFKCIDKENSNKEFEKQPNINSSDPIPMPYESLNKNSDFTSDRSEVNTKTDQMASSTEYALTLSIFGSDCTVFSWLDKLTVLLQQKIYLICLIEAENAIKYKNTGTALKYIKLALHSVKCIEVTLGGKLTFNAPFDAYVLACYAYHDLAVNYENIEQYVNEFTSVNEKYLEIKQRLDSICDADINIAREMPTDLAECVYFTETCLTIIMNNNEQRITVEMRVRLGIIYHSLGSYYMKKSQELCDKYNKRMEEAEVLFEKTQNYFEQCRKCYNMTKEYNRLAWTKLNMAQFYRICAYFHSDIENFQKYYLKAILEYKMTLRDLGCRDFSPDLWDNINLELVKTLKSQGAALLDIYRNEAMNKKDEEKYRKCIEISFSDARTIYDDDIYKMAFINEAIEIHNMWGEMYYIRRKQTSDEEASRFQKLSEENFHIISKLFEYNQMPYESLNVILNCMQQLHSIEMAGKTVWITSLKDLKTLTYRGLTLLLQCKRLFKQKCQTKENLHPVRTLEESLSITLSSYHAALLEKLQRLKSNFGQFRQKKKKINLQLINNLCKKCSETKIELDHIISFVEKIKMELLAYL